VGYISHKAFESPLILESNFDDNANKVKSEYFYYLNEN